MRTNLHLPHLHVPHFTHEEFVSVGAIGLMLALSALIICVFVAVFAVGPDIIPSSPR